MSVGNWREHVLIECVDCGQVMGYHKLSKDAVCNDCETEAQEMAWAKQEQECWT